MLPRFVREKKLGSQLVCVMAVRTAHDGSVENFDLSEQRAVCTAGVLMLSIDVDSFLLLYLSIPLPPPGPSSLPFQTFLWALQLS